MSKRAALFSFVVALAVQVAILGAIPFRKVRTIARGREVTLKVQPVDPYSIMSGYYVILSFSISRPSSFATPPELLPGTICYAIVERGEDGIWIPVELALESPSDLPANRAVLIGTYEHNHTIRYDIENFYIPEARRQEIEQDLRKNPDKVLVDVKVDESGDSILQRLRIDARVYE